ncbi:MAG: YicC/YloC family endoribonuclease [Candidatus Omnitrophota bacterium]
MLKSMTGFGKASERTPYGAITVEIKTLNHKSLSITCSPFNGFFLLEEKIKDIFQGKLFRGKVFVKVSRESGEGRKPLHKIIVNEIVANEYIKKIQKAQKQLTIAGELKIQDVIGFPGVVESDTSKKAGQLWPYIKKAAVKALNKLVEYRKTEGARLTKDFIKRLDKIRKNLKEIRKYEKQNVSKYRDRLTRTMLKISKQTELDKERLEEEAALFARNCDISEELTRLENHVAVYKRTMRAATTDAGKKLDFIAQEMHRETNTIGSKAEDFRISKAVIEVKSEIEKMREQAKNIE